MSDAIAIKQHETHMSQILRQASKGGLIVQANYTADSLIGCVEFRGKKYRIEIREES